MTGGSGRPRSSRSGICFRRSHFLLFIVSFRVQKASHGAPAAGQGENEAFIRLRVENAIRYDQRASGRLTLRRIFRSPQSGRLREENCARIWCVPGFQPDTHKLRPAFCQHPGRKRGRTRLRPEGVTKFILSLRRSRSRRSARTPPARPGSFHDGKIFLFKSRACTCLDRRLSAMRERAKTITPPTGRSSRCTTRTQPVSSSPSARRSSSGIPPGSSVDKTPAGLRQTTIRLSLYKSSPSRRLDAIQV